MVVESLLDWFMFSVGTFSLLGIGFLLGGRFAIVMRITDSDERKSLLSENAKLRLVLSHAKAELNAASWPDYYYDYDDDRLMQEIESLGIEAIALPELPPRELSEADIEAAKSWAAPASGMECSITREDILNDGLADK